MGCESTSHKRIGSLPFSIKISKFSQTGLDSELYYGIFSIFFLFVGIPEIVSLDLLEHLSNYHFSP